MILLLQNIVFKPFLDQLLSVKPIYKTHSLNRSDSYQNRNRLEDLYRKCYRTVLTGK